MAPPRMYLFPLFLLTFLIAAPLTGQGDAGEEFSPAEVAFFETTTKDFQFAIYGTRASSENQARELGERDSS